MLVLHNVEMIEFKGELHPKIDVRKISKEVMEKLIFQKNRLTGNQIKFIRTYLSMSLRTFAVEVVNESHMAVKKWEDYGEQATNMDLNIEKILRLYILDKVVMPEKQISKFRKQYQKVNRTVSREISKEVFCVNVEA